MPAPENLLLSGGQKSMLVESDVFDICERVREIDPNLFIVTLDHPVHEPYRFAVMENCPDNCARMVKRYEELDARVIDDLRYFAAKPLPERLREIERNEDKEKAEMHERELEEMYDAFGGAMWSQLDHDGFIAGGRGVSYAKRGVKSKVGRPDLVRG